MLPAFALSACTTTSVTYHAPTCFTDLLGSTKLAQPTPHAPLPSNSAGAWVDFGNREAGQLDQANADKTAIVGIGQTCDRWQAEAKKEAEKKPWYRRLF